MGLRLANRHLDDALAALEHAADDIIDAAYNVSATRRRRLKATIKTVRRAIANVAAVRMQVATKRRKKKARARSLDAHDREFEDNFVLDDDAPLDALAERQLPHE